MKKQSSWSFPSRPMALGGALGMVGAVGAGPARAHPLFATRNRDGLYAFGPHQPLLSLERTSSAPIMIGRFDIVEFSTEPILSRVVSRDGATGVTAASPNEWPELRNLVKNPVAPFLIGKDAREYPIFVDIDTRQPDSPAGWGRIRGLSFDGIDIKTRGNILIQGQPGHAVEELRLSDISMRVENGVDLTMVNGKPRGNRAHAPRTGAADYSSLSGQIVIGHARQVTVSNVSTIGVTAPDQRQVFVTSDVKDLRVDGQVIAPSIP